jgi:hypothetical protein
MDGSFSVIIVAVNIDLGLWHMAKHYREIALVFYPRRFAFWVGLTLPKLVAINTKFGEESKYLLNKPTHF